MQNGLRLLLSASLLLAIAACSSKFDTSSSSVSLSSKTNTAMERGHQYKDGKFTADLKKVKKINSATNYEPYRFKEQVQQVMKHSSRLRKRYSVLYAKILKWSQESGKVEDLDKYHIQIAQMAGKDRFGNVLFTGYFSPIIEVREKPNATYKYPLYASPRCRVCPTRKAIYDGALKGKGLEIAYSASLLDNFLMEVQGSGFIHYGDSDKIEYLSYGARNNRRYTSIGRILINQGEVKREDMSMAAIKKWVKTHNESQVRKLLEANESFIFFRRVDTHNVFGSAGVPLVAGASVASDNKLLPPGSVIIAEVPQIDGQGNWTGKYKLKPMIALDRGGAVDGGHVDLYYGIGNRAGLMAGYNKFYGRLWKLGMKNSYSENPWEYNKDTKK